jgi:protein TonB
MKTNYSNTDMLDIIFERRNKSYGAYVLRREQEKSMAQALFIMGTSILLLFAGNFIAGKLQSTTKLSYKEVEVEVSNLGDVKDKTKVEEVVKTNTEQSKAKATIENPEKRIVAENQDHADSFVTNNDLEKFESGLTTNFLGAIDGSGVADGKGTGTSLEVVAPSVVYTEPTIHFTAEIMPQYPGGEKALMKFLSRHTEFPEMERMNGVEGKATIKFVVNEDGSITDASVLKSASKGFSKEALRVVALLPKFTPGMQNGKKVKVQYVLPFYFRLND